MSKIFYRLSNPPMHIDWEKWTNNMIVDPRTEDEIKDLNFAIKYIKNLYPCVSNDIWNNIVYFIYYGEYCIYDWNWYDGNVVEYMVEWSSNIKLQKYNPLLTIKSSKYLPKEFNTEIPYVIKSGKQKKETRAVPMNFLDYVDKNINEDEYNNNFVNIVNSVNDEISCEKSPSYSSSSEYEDNNDDYENNNDYNNDDYENNNDYSNDDYEENDNNNDYNNDEENMNPPHRIPVYGNHSYLVWNPFINRYTAFTNNSYASRIDYNSYKFYTQVATLVIPDPKIHYSKEKKYKHLASIEYFIPAKANFFMGFFILDSKKYNIQKISLNFNDLELQYNTKDLTTIEIMDGENILLFNTFPNFKVIPMDCLCFYLVSITLYIDFKNIGMIESPEMEFVMSYDNRHSIMNDFIPYETYLPCTSLGEKNNTHKVGNITDLIRSKKKWKISDRYEIEGGNLNFIEQI